MTSHLSITFPQRLRAHSAGHSCFIPSCQNNWIFSPCAPRVKPPKYSITLSWQITTQTTEHSKYHAWVLYQNRIIKKAPIPDVPYIIHCWVRQHLKRCLQPCQATGLGQRPRETKREDKRTTDLYHCWQTSPFYSPFLLTQHLSTRRIPVKELRAEGEFLAARLWTQRNFSSFQPLLLSKWLLSALALS